MDIRDAVEEDLDLLKEGLLEVRRIERRPAGDIPVTDADIESFRKGIGNRTVRIISNEEGRTSGFIYYRTDFAVPYVHGQFLWIDIIYIRERERGKGLGTALYRDAISYARSNGLDRIVIDIFQSNIRSRKFHDGMDFDPFYTIFVKKL